MPISDEQHFYRLTAIRRNGEETLILDAVSSEKAREVERILRGYCEYDNFRIEATAEGNKSPVG